MARRSSTSAQHAQQRATGGRLVTVKKGKKTQQVSRPIGRPTALTDRVEDALVGFALEGLPNDTACHLAGIGPATFYRWMQRGEDAQDTLDQTGSLPPEEERFRDFRERILDARAQAEARMVHVVFSAVNGGAVTMERPLLGLDGQPLIDPKTGNVLMERTFSSPDGRLALQYLQRARAHNWSQQAANINAKVEVSGPDGAPIEVEHTLEQVTSLADRLMAVRQQFEAERAEEQREADLAKGLADGTIVEGEVEG